MKPEWNPLPLVVIIWLTLLVITGALGTILGGIMLASGITVVIYILAWIGSMDDPD